MSESKDIQSSISLSSDSKERWARHAISKLSKGYKLILSKTRNTANFYKGSGDFETCPHRTATRLIKEGFLVETGEHMLGIVYELKEEFKENIPVKKKPLKPASPVKIKEVGLSEDLEDDLIDDDLEDDLDDDLGDDIDEDLADSDGDDIEDDLLADLDD